MEKKVGSHDRLLERLGEWDKTKTPADTAIEVFIRETCAAHPDEPRDIPIIRALIRFRVPVSPNQPSGISADQAGNGTTPLALRPHPLIRGWGLACNPVAEIRTKPLLNSLVKRFTSVTCVIR
jgi:hypothetical protein